MAPSQLKQLKASLREKGIVGPQQSKKQKQKNSRSGAAAANRIQRNAALEAIREQFNPFEVRAPSRPSKFAVTSNRPDNASAHRPGVTRGVGEERRKETLLKELQSRNKIGGLLDRRFGENDPTMTLEQREAERFARESQKRFKKASMFNLEEDEEEEMQLTHLGQSLSFDLDGEKDDFEDNMDDVEGDSDVENNKKRKRMLAEEVDDMEGMADEDGEEDGEQQPERKKSKNEVMKELIAKSKHYKYERQKLKEDDNELRSALDQGLPEILAMMRDRKPEPKAEPIPTPKLEPEIPSAPIMDPDRAALLNGKDRDAADREYDQRLRQMAFDKRSKPADRTKTEEEKAEEDAKRLRELENERLKRMRGEEESEAEDVENAAGLEDDSEPDDAKQFGLAQVSLRPEVDVEGEDDFIIDEDLVESDPAADISFSDFDSDDEAEGEEESSDEEDDADDTEFIGGLQLPEDDSKGVANGLVANPSENTSLAYTYPCPENLKQFLSIVKGVDLDNLPIVIQRIRALYHSRLHPDNKAKLEQFSKVLVDYVVHLANQTPLPPFAVLENILRHVHSLAKTYPEEVAVAFRAHLRQISEERPFKLLPGDLVLLTGIATIFPTSDHFHPVVTPAILTMGRYLGQAPTETLADAAVGAFVGSLCLQYQTFSKRYVPELMNYTLNSLMSLASEEIKNKSRSFPLRPPTSSIRLKAKNYASTPLRKLQFRDVVPNNSDSIDPSGLKLSLISTFITLVDSAADLWSTKTAFPQIFNPPLSILRHLRHSTTSPASTTKFPTLLADQLQQSIDKLGALVAVSERTREPLMLHNHRPLAIRMSIPKFEESFNPSRHYDPDRERAELNKLKAEHKKERKGAMRELRKDANFIARESLREKKEKDAEYERKYKRLVAEIQGEEGREAKVYEKEKKARKQSRK
ncbi:nucleolar complex protein 14 [Myotisia sp. PD_48]|nr:nucleolar complex protein 14 [Myotisia sp. PD_48]